eukprot:m.192512 g.192512  ORF g.192512 m.192512 type:complete len:1263 (+) comp15657_c0_seq2:325-4113(+)
MRLFARFLENFIRWVLTTTIVFILFCGSSTFEGNNGINPMRNSYNKQGCLFPCILGVGANTTDTTTTTITTSTFTTKETVLRAGGTEKGLPQFVIYIFIVVASLFFLSLFICFITTFGSSKNGEDRQILTRKSSARITQNHELSEVKSSSTPMIMVADLIPIKGIDATQEEKMKLQQYSVARKSFELGSKVLALPTEGLEVVKARLRVDKNGKACSPASSSSTKPIAVKRLRPDAGTTQKHMLHREMLLMAQANHINVMPCLGVCLEQPQQPYLLMEIPHSGKLLPYLRSKASKDITSEDLLSYAVQAAEGMRYLSNKKIILRNLTCNSIYLGETNLTKIGNFTAARDLKKTGITEGDKMVHKTMDDVDLVYFKWCAPETLDGVNFSVASDVWSFGITLWEIISFGASPYPDSLPEEIVNNVKRGLFMPRSYTEHCSEELWKTVQGCWVKEPSGRLTFSSIATSLNDLQVQAKNHIKLPLKDRLRSNDGADGTTLSDVFEYLKDEEENKKNQNELGKKATIHVPNPRALKARIVSKATNVDYESEGSDDELHDYNKIDEEELLPLPPLPTDQAASKSKENIKPEVVTHKSELKSSVPPAAPVAANPPPKTSTPVTNRRELKAGQRPPPAQAVTQTRNQPTAARVSSPRPAHQEPRGTPPTTQRSQELGVPKTTPRESNVNADRENTGKPTNIGPGSNVKTPPSKIKHSSPSTASHNTSSKNAHPTPPEEAPPQASPRREPEANPRAPTEAPPPSKIHADRIKAGNPSSSPIRKNLESNAPEEPPPPLRAMKPTDSPSADKPKDNIPRRAPSTSKTNPNRKTEWIHPDDAATIVSQSEQEGAAEVEKVLKNHEQLQLTQKHSEEQEPSANASSTKAVPTNAVSEQDKQDARERAKDQLKIVVEEKEVEYVNVPSKTTTSSNTEQPTDQDKHEAVKRAEAQLSVVVEEKDVEYVNVPSANSSNSAVNEKLTSEQLKQEAKKRAMEQVKDIQEDKDVAYENVQPPSKVEIDGLQREEAKERAERQMSVVVENGEVEYVNVPSAKDRVPVEEMDFGDIATITNEHISDETQKDTFVEVMSPELQYEDEIPPEPTPEKKIVVEVLEPELQYKEEYNKSDTTLTNTPPSNPAASPKLHNKGPKRSEAGVKRIGRRDPGAPTRHGLDLTREDAEALLVPGKPGDFLIRRSKNKKANMANTKYVLSFLDVSTGTPIVRHYAVGGEDFSNFYIIGILGIKTPVLASMEKLLDFYYDNDITPAGGRLVRPCP